MQYFVIGFLLLAGFIFWGAGLAMLFTPRAYRRFALIFAVPVGLSVQSLVVWAGAHTGWCGTDSYGRASLALPTVFLLAALWRIRGGRRTRLAWFWPLIGLMIVHLAVMLAPLAIGTRELATVSVGSLDAPDYAAGARVFKEFASTDRSGFIGQTEVVSVGAVDNFFDFWLRTNHFTPSALIALNGSILGLQPYQLTGLLTIVLLTATLPMVFWLARSGFGYRSWPSVAITAIYAFNPVNWHAVYNVSPAQILAANAIALLTWCGLALWRRWKNLAQKWAMTGLLLIAYGLILGSYNFIVVVCLAPAIAVAGGDALWGRRWRQFGRFLLQIAAPLAAAAVIYWERSAGVVERFLLFRETRFGWYIPPLGPDGWLGLVEGTWIKSYPGWLGTMLSLFAGLLILLGVTKGLRRSPPHASVVCLAVMPVLIGYGILVSRVSPSNSLASYDAYKLFSVFLPTLLAGFCLWLDEWMGSPERRWKSIGLVGAVLVVALNLGGEWRYYYRISHPVLLADKNLAQLNQIERLPSVASLNLRLPDGWDRLWANSLLLRKRQYFELPSYEGRKPTPLIGEWDLVGKFFRFDLPLPADSLHPVEGFTLLRRASAEYMEADFVDGWVSVIRDDPDPGSRTRWAEADAATLRLVNPHSGTLSVKLHMTLRAFSSRECEIRFGDRIVGRLALSSKPQEWTKSQIDLPPGVSILTLTTLTPADSIGGRIKRPLTMAVDGMDIEVLADPRRSRN
jgi:hypothetical protein